MFTEPRAHYAPIWGYVDPLTLRHGQAKSRITGTIMGINAGAVFFDGHAAPIDEDYYMNDVRQILADE